MSCVILLLLLLLLRVELVLLKLVSCLCAAFAPVACFACVVFRALVYGCASIFVYQVGSCLVACYGCALISSCLGWSLVRFAVFGAGVFFGFSSSLGCLV